MLDDKDEFETFLFGEHVFNEVVSLVALASVFGIKSWSKLIRNVIMSYHDAIDPIIDTKLNRTTPKA